MNNLIVEEVWGFGMKCNELHFYIKWKNKNELFNSWESYSRVRSEITFKNYIENLWITYESEIELNKEIHKKKLASKIKEIKTTHLKAIKIFKENDFDQFKFKTYQLLYHFLMPNEAFESTFIDLFVLNELYLVVSDYQNKCHKFLLGIRAVDPFISLKIENNADLKSPSSFTYINCIKTPALISALIKTESSYPCKCSKNCNSNNTECCGYSQGRGFSYKLTECGDILCNILNSTLPIIECGEQCVCDSYCINRLSQRIPYPRAFKLYKSKRYGWTLKSDMKMKKGFLITLINGMLSETSQMKNNCYIFRFALNENEYAINALDSGNIARFINHSCHPNAIIRVITDHSKNLKDTRLAVFALRDIDQNDEITVNYDKYNIGSLDDSMKCLCGSSKCKGFIYSSKKLNSPETAVKPQNHLDDNVETNTSVVNLTRDQINIQSEIEIKDETVKVNDTIQSENTANDNSVDESEYLLEEVSLNIKDETNLRHCSVPGCSFSCSTAKTFRKHKALEHGNGNVTICSCGFIFLTHQVYSNHIKLTTRYQKDFDQFVRELKKTHRNRDYHWIHNSHVRAQLPDNAEFVGAYKKRYTAYIEQNFKLLCEIQKKYFKN